MHYLIAQIEIADRETYTKYEAGFMDIFLAYKGRMLSVDEGAQLLEGEWSYTRTVLVEFPSKEDALDWLTNSMICDEDSSFSIYFLCLGGM